MQILPLKIGIGGKHFRFGHAIGNRADNRNSRKPYRQLRSQIHV